MRIERDTAQEEAGAVQQEQAIDFDRLAEPEGSEPIPSNEPEQPEEPEAPAEPAQEATPTPESEPTPEPEQAQEPEKPVEAEQSQEQSEQQNFYQAMFDKLKERLGDQYQIPEDLNSDNAFDKFAEEIFKNADFSEVFHPEVQKLQDVVNANGGDFGKALNDYNSLRSWRNMGDQQLMEWHLENNINMTPEAAKESIKEMNLKYEAAKVRQEYDAFEEQYAQEKQQRQYQDYQKQMEVLDAERDKETAEVLGKFQNVNDIYGIPVTAKHKQDFPEKFKAWVTPDETGEAPIAKLINDNEALMRLVFMAEYKDQAVKELIFNKTNQVKKDIQKKLDPEPQINKKNIEQPSSEMDWSALLAPAKD